MADFWAFCWNPVYPTPFGNRQLMRGPRSTVRMVLLRTSSIIGYYSYGKVTILVIYYLGKKRLDFLKKCLIFRKNACLFKYLLVV